MDAIASQFRPGSLARAFQSFRQDAGDPNAAGGARRRPAEGALTARVSMGARDRDRDEGRKPDGVADGPQSATMAALSYRRAENTSLFIKTREGDTVELKIRSREAMSLTAAQLQDGDQTATAVQQRSNSSTRISFEVEGDLSEDELAAIREVIEQADALAAQFFNDDIAGAFAAAERLQMDGAQLASVAFSASLREQITYTEKSTARPAGAPPATGLPGPQPAANVASPPAEPPPAPQAAATPTPASMPLQIPDSAPPTPAAAPPATDPLATIRQFLTDLVDQLSAPGAAAAKGTNLELSLKFRIFQSVVTTRAATQPAAGDAAKPLPDLVPETLGALAAQQDPPLRAQA